MLFTAAGPKRIIIKRAVGPGIMYPADPVELRTKIEALIDEADIPQLPGAVNVCIMPTGTFDVSGAVAAHAVKALEPGAFDRVIMIAPPTFANFQGCSIPAVHYYRTPLGDVPLDGAAVRNLTVTTLIQRHAVVYRDRPYNDPQVNRQMFHEREYAIEIPLTFLQVRLGEFKLIPLVIGDVRNKGKSVEGNVKSVMRTLRSVMDDRTLLVICADFTKYGSIHDYTPFANDIVSNISKLDMEAFKRIQSRDVVSFRRYVQDTKNLKRAAVPLELAMRLAPPNARGLMLDYEVSGAGQASPTASVSYASLVFFDPTRPVAATESALVVDAESESNDAP
jgi:hypothetical protein